MKEFEYGGKIYKLPTEIVEYLNELEYYYEFSVGKRVIDVHFGIIGHIQSVFEDYKSVPVEVVNGDHDTYLEEINKHLTIMPHLLLTYWLLVKAENNDNFYCLPYVYFHLMPSEGDNDLFNNQEPQANSITDV